MIVWTKDFKEDRETAYQRLEEARRRFFQHFPYDASGKPDLSQPPKAGYQLELRKWRDKFKGQRCFVIGNGPSLKKMDLSPLKDEITIGLNGLYKQFDNWGWHTDYLIFEDTEQTELRGPEIVSIKGPTKLASIYNAYAFEADESTLFFNARRADGYYWKKLHPMFSTQFEHIVFLGSTVTYIGLQLAFHLGFQNVYLIGVDNSYGKLSELFPPGKIRITEENYHIVQQCHFSKNYYKIGDQLGVPNTKLQNEAYAEADRVFKEFGRNVYNAGVDSKLDVFEKVDYTSLFKQSACITKPEICASQKEPSKEKNEERKKVVSLPYSDEIKTILSALKTMHRNYSIFGAGKIGKAILETAQNCTFPLPSFFIDDNPTAKELSGIPIVSLDKFKQVRTDEIILGTDTFQEDMRKRLSDAGIPTKAIDITEIIPVPTARIYDRSSNHKQPSKSVLFISHASNQSGAPLSLRILMKYFSRHTDWDIRCLIRRKNGPINDFSDLAPTDFVEQPGEREEQTKKRLHRLKQEFAGRRPDFIYSNTAVNGDIIAKLGLEDIPTIVHVRELEESFKLFSPLQDTVFREQPLHYFAVSNAVTNYLISKKGIPAEKITLVPVALECGNVIESAREIINTSFELPDKQIVCGMGTPGYRKGTDLFIETADQYLSNRNDTLFVWIGGGEKLPEYRAIIEKKGLQKGIVFTDGLDNPFPILKKASLLLMTSRDDPFPRVNMEASLFKIPIICFSESGGSPEFTADDCGVALAKIDSTLLAETTSDLLHDRTRLQLLGENARRKTLDNYDIEIVGETALRTINCYFNE